jgi:thioredoxin 1
MNTLEMTADNFSEILGKGTVLVDFWAPWCAPCRAFGPIYEAAAAKHPEVTFAKVDTEREPALASEFRISAIPTLMVFRDGILLFRHPGLIAAAALEELLKHVAAMDMDAIRKAMSAPNAEGRAKTARQSAPN